MTYSNYLLQQMRYISRVGRGRASPQVLSRLGQHLVQQLNLQDMLDVMRSGFHPGLTPPGVKVHVPSALPHFLLLPTRSVCNFRLVLAHHEQLLKLRSVSSLGEKLLQARGSSPIAEEEEKLLQEYLIAREFLGPP